MKTNKTFKILSIDGGGIKGLYSATFLKNLEEQLQKEKGGSERIVDYFDLICGTSTGGLIALAMSIRKETQEICNFYEQNGAEIFPNGKSKWRLFKQTLFGGKYNDEALKIALKKMLAENTMGDSESLLCIPSFDYTNFTYAVFKFDHKEGNLSRHNKIPMVDVGLATSAAPTYFPLAQIEALHNVQYVDGGVWCNNPSLIGLMESLRYFVGPGKAYDDISVLSISSINNVKGKAPDLTRNRSFINWAPDLFELGMTGQNEFTDYILSTLDQYIESPISYLRIPSPELSPEQQKHISMDYATNKAYVLMKTNADHMYHKYKNHEVIKNIFAEKKTYKTQI